MRSVQRPGSLGVRRLLAPNILVPMAILGAVGVSIALLNVGEGPKRPSPRSVSIRERSAPTTSLAGLERTVVDMERRVSANPDDAEAAVRLADTLMRQSRATGDAGLVARAEAVLLGARGVEATRYDVEQMLGSVYLSLHKFRAAIEAAERCRRMRPDDPVNAGILGDAHLELGEYDTAFKAFDEMMRLRPNAASYARVSYARELQGDLPGAVAAMRLAAEAVGGSDLEAIAWHHAQLGELYLQLGDPAQARHAFGVALAAFPEHPLALFGSAKAMVAAGDTAGAVALLKDLATRQSNPDVHALLGELLESSGEHAEASRHYTLAEAAWRSDASEPRHLARFLATRGRALEAVAVAERAAISRQDIYTDDALAWAYHKAGRHDDAERAIARALRTGSRHPDILAHAAAIRGAGAAPGHAPSE